MKIILDFDDVITCTARRCYEVYNKIYCDRKEYKKADLNKHYRWDMKDTMPLLSSVQDIAGRDDFYDVDYIFKKDALKCIEELSKNYEIIICTSGGYFNQIQKAKLIDKYLPFIKGVIFVANIEKSMVDMSECIFVDDNANNLEMVNAKIKICFIEGIYEYNENWKGIRVSNWKELMEVIQKNA